jgi:chemotaxis protein CheZ
MPRTSFKSPPGADRQEAAVPAVTNAISPEVLRDAVEEIMSTMEGDLTGDHIAISAQLRSLAQYIEATRQELSRLRPNDIAEQHIPNATDELDAVVKETEEATNAIMQAAEEIESVNATLEGEAMTKLSDAVTKIYEACSFQDITGQRIRKVVRALKEIEGKVGEMVATLDGGPSGSKAAVATPPPAEAVQDDASLLNGPQLPGGAISQDDIDSLFSKTD